MIRARMIAIIGLFLLPLGLTAQEKHTIKPSRDKKGDLTNITREEKVEESVRVIGPDGKEIQKKAQTILITATFREEILEKAVGQRPTKLSRTYDKAEAKLGDMTQSFAYAGKTVLIEKSGDAYNFSIDGKNLEGKDAGTLPKDFDPKRPSEEESEKLFLPGKPVAEGEAWTVDAKALLTSLSGKEQAVKTFDLDKAKAGGKLVKVYKKDGAKYGVIDFEVNTPIKEFAGRFPCKEGATMTIKMNIDVCIDGTVSGGKTKTVNILRGKADITKDDKPTGAVLEFDITNTVTGTGTPAKK
jgi:hypothetical protein